jgi:D-alanyl-D-alanine carboxypeptidase
MLAAKGRVVVGLATVVAATGMVGTADAASVKARDQALTKTIRATIKEASIPGAIVGVWQPKKAPYIRAFGVRNTATKARMRTNFYSRIGSETKTFAVTALLQLVAQGKASLDDPIGKYVPNIVNGDTATLRDLADMTSGIPSYTQTEAFYRDLTTDPFRNYTRPQLLGYVANDPALYAPGEGFNYSNTNTVLIGIVVEQVSGQTLPDYIEPHILKPLKMNHTSFPTNAAFPTPHAQGYTEQTADGKVADATNWNPSWGWSAGAMISTVGDMRIWAEHLVTGEGLLPAGLQAERLASVKNGAGAYGIGMFSTGGWIGHNGSLPGYQTVVVYRPAAKTTVVALMNTDIEYEKTPVSTVMGRAVTTALDPKHVYNPGG